MDETFHRQHVPRSSLTPALIEKWSAPVLAEGFVPFPKRMLRCLTTLFGQSPELEQLATILAVIDYRRPQLTRPPSIDFLAFLSGLPVERIRLRLDELEEKGWASKSGPEDRLEVSLDGFLRAIEGATPYEEEATRSTAPPTDEPPF